jgi:hypothetical protein
MSTADSDSGSPEEVALGIPSPWYRDMRRGARDSDLLYFLAIWLPVFLAIQMIASLVAGSLHPAGWDDCEATAPATAALIQRVAAVVAVVGSLLFALWRRRILVLLAAVPFVAVSGLLWWLILWAPQNC